MTEAASKMQDATEAYARKLESMLDAERRMVHELQKRQQETLVDRMPQTEAAETTAYTATEVHLIRAHCASIRRDLSHLADIAARYRGTTHDIDEELDTIRTVVALLEAMAA